MELGFSGPTVDVLPTALSYLLCLTWEHVPLAVWANPGVCEARVREVLCRRSH